MEFEWHEAKRRQNLKEHKVDLASVEQFEFESALIIPDDREDYGEERYQALGFIGMSLHMLVFTWRDEKLRVISLRRAEPMERKLYAQKIKGQN
jgi:uncharacterized protein